MTLIFILVFITLFLYSKMFVDYIHRKRNKANSRFKKYLEKTDTDIYDLELNRPLSERILIPLYKKITNRISKLFPKKRQEILKNKLVHAGLMLSPQDFFLIHIAVMIILPASLSLLLYIGKCHVKYIVIAFIYFTAAGYLIPKYWLDARIRKRKYLATKELPGIIDLLTVSMEAGLSFDMALTKIISRSEGFLIDELELALNKIKRGIPRRDALREMAQKLDIDELTNFIGVILQAEKLGISISKILRVQSAQIRESRRQWAKEKGGKAAVKIVLPLVIFILPVIFIVLLGPPILNAKNIFSW